METQDWYSVNEFAPGSYQITEGGRFNMLLLVGDDKAVAIDGGIGIANLRKLYESITDKPIDFILTHTHWDHVGAASQWEKVGVHPVGETLLANDLSKLEQGFLNMWKNNGNTFPEWFDEEAYSIKPATFGWTLEEGDTFDLGNRKIHVYDTPGHSPCSISLYDEREKILVSGDLIRCEEYLFLQVPTAVLSDYAPSLRKLEKVAAENEVRWITSGHTEPYPDPSIIGELAQNMEDLEAGKYDPPAKVDGGAWGEVDEYVFPRAKGVGSGSREKVTRIDETPWTRKAGMRSSSSRRTPIRYQKLRGGTCSCSSERKRPSRSTAESAWAACAGYASPLPIFLWSTFSPTRTGTTWARRMNGSRWAFTPTARISSRTTTPRVAGISLKPGTVNPFQKYSTPTPSPYRPESSAGRCPKAIQSISAAGKFRSTTRRATRHAASPCMMRKSAS